MAKKSLTQVDKITKSYKFAKDSYADAIEKSQKAVRYLNNESWTTDEKNTAKLHSKPTLTYNIIIPIISTLQGNEQLNAKRAQFKALNVESVPLVDIIQDRYNALTDEQDLEEKIQIAFGDALTTRMGGWIERNFMMNAEGYLDYTYRNINNMRIYVDPETRASDFKLEQCRWVIKEGWETLDIIKERYSIDQSELKSQEEIGWYNQLQQVFARFTNSNYTDNINYDKENDRYKILEMQERVTQKICKVYDGEKYLSVSIPEFNKMRAENPGIVKLAEMEEDKIKVSAVIPFFENALVLDKDLDLPVARFDCFPIFSYNYNIQVTEQTCLVDLLVDVQDDINKGKSQARDYVTQMLSGGIFIDKREKEAIKQLKTKGNQPNQVYELNNPAALPQKLPPGNIPPDILNNAENSFQYAHRVSLISEAMRGETARSGESGVLFEQKVQRAAAAINPYFRNVQRLRKHIAEDFVDNFSYVYSETERVIVVKQKDVFIEKLINLNTGSKVLNSVANASLYVELDEGQDNITTKEDNFNKMLALINVISQVNPQFVDIKTLLENAPVVGADKMIEYIDKMLQSQAQQAEAQGQVAQQQQQLELTKQALENVKMERGMATDEQKLRLDAEKLKSNKNTNKAEA